MAYPGAGSFLLTGIFSVNDSSKSFTGGAVGSSTYTRLNIASITSTSFNVKYSNHRSETTYLSTPISYIAFI